jgi:hypothetical protein
MPDLVPVFAELRSRLSRYAVGLRESSTTTDANASGSRKAAPGEVGTYLLLGAATERYPGGQLFAMVRTGKRYVSYHLMGVYLAPDLLEGMSPELARRMQGKSCFNFTTANELLFDELEALTARCKEEYAERGLLLPH